MKRSIHFFGAVIVAMSLMVLTDASARAGRIGGPMSISGVVPISNSVYYDIPFAAGEQAVVMINGAGNAMVQVFMYDADGHVVAGTGLADRKLITLKMDVYRSGLFRVEIRNLGNRDGNFTLTTN